MSTLSRWIPADWKVKIKQKLGVPGMFWSLENLKNNGFHPRKIIDIGAYQGEWTQEALAIFPAASFLMVEAQSIKEPFLSKLAGANPDQLQYSIALLGADNDAEVVFHEMETASSVLTEHYATSATPTTKKTVQLDALTKARGFEGANFLKLDTQGYELEILKGGENTLRRAEAVLMEVSLLDIHRGVPLMREVVDFMGDRGFQVYDICSFTRRPLDKALWQTDMIFVKKESALLSDKRYA
ncbi:MAG: FkbM family methyltransferase [Ferruginibacter sp.]|nr:FkbM family methyltransferase [Cytophagales bacterium]